VNDSWLTGNELLDASSLIAIAEGRDNLNSLTTTMFTFEPAPTANIGVVAPNDFGQRIPAAVTTVLFENNLLFSAQDTRLMHTRFRMFLTTNCLLLVTLAVVSWASVANARDDAKDWPMYNADVIGSHCWNI
jgi:hypothetical protein